MTFDRELGIYVHIPFCRAKCHYCDFNSYPGMEAMIPGYFDALNTEAELYGEKARDKAIKTVFIGGGTPSLVDSRHLYNLMNGLKSSFHISGGAEISIETNPGTLDYGKLMAYRAMGINRLSMGLQAWQDGLLKKLGRIHRAREFSENFQLARKVGFKNINVDLIFGIPGQTFKDWVETLEKVVDLGAAHISCYSLKIEEGTEFGDRLEREELIPMEDELDREMYYEAVERLGKHGYRHYEISNFALEGCECRHNLIYWKGESYVGLGAGAHSYYGGKRYNDIYNVEAYISRMKNRTIPMENIEEIKPEDEIAEYMILGLRLIEGIGKKEFKQRFDSNIRDLFGTRLDALIKKQLLVEDGDRIRLTPKGLDLANEVFIEFI